jgi:broad specificity phosphatase PhoE
MKWPKTLTIIRHGESIYNAMRGKKLKSKKYLDFKSLYDKEFGEAKNPDWPSDKLRNLAQESWDELRIFVSDHSTPLAKEGEAQALETGKKLHNIIELPDIIYVSPHLRTLKTLEYITKSWPELNDIRVVSDERIREQEHGLQTLYNDARVFNVFNPDQALLSRLEGGYWYRHLNGESKADVRDRVRSFMATLIRENFGQNVLVISHHLTLLSIRATIERWFPEKFMSVDEMQKPINCGVTIYDGDSSKGKDGKLVLREYNKKIY